MNHKPVYRTAPATLGLLIRFVVRKHIGFEKCPAISPSKYPADGRHCSALTLSTCVDISTQLFQACILVGGGSVIKVAYPVKFW